MGENEGSFGFAWLSETIDGLLINSQISRNHESSNHRIL